jgi:hypothetical protein
MLRQMLEQDLLKLNLAQLDNNNYVLYLQKLCSSLFLSLDDHHDEQDYMTFISEMKNHPSAAGCVAAFAAIYDQTHKLLH